MVARDSNAAQRCLVVHTRHARFEDLTRDCADASE
jgi:hypothetical protein